ncbi:MAG: calcium-binding protein [Methylococcaceae bacterium]
MATYKGDDNGNIYSGTDYTDYIHGNGGNDTLSGLGGNDLIKGESGKDIINGGLGGDDLFGGSGADTYLIAKNDGKDNIDNFDKDGSMDVVMFTDVASTEITKVSRNSNDLLLNYGNNSQLTIWNYFAGTNYLINQFQFSDGVTWVLKDIKSKVLQGTDGVDRLYGYDGQHNNLDGLAGNDFIQGGGLSDTLNGGLGNDVIYGFLGNDILNGGLGDDYLTGGNGEDTYLIANNDGKDTIDNNDGEGNSIDVVKFSDVASADIIDIIQVNRGFGHVDLLLSYGSNSQLTIYNYFSDVNSHIDQFQFSDGVAWTREDIIHIVFKPAQPTDGDDVIKGYDDESNNLSGLAGNDKLYGGHLSDTLNGGRGNDQLAGNGGDDVLLGKAGNDYMDGGEGADTYLIAKNDGLDRIYNSHVDDSIDVVKFTDVASTDITQVSNGNYDGYIDFERGHLLLSYGNNSQLTISWYFAPDYLGTKTSLDQFQFSDGVTWRWEDINQKVLQPTNGDDTLYGYDDEHNNLSGLAGNDKLFGGNLSDTLNGGQGDDSLQGNAGADTYLFAKGDGKDVIDHFNFDDTTTIDIVKFTNVNLTDITSITFDSIESNLVINYGNSDQLAFYVFNPVQLRFADGSSLTNFVLGYSDDNTLTGTAANDAMLGFEGSDSLSGGAGDDLYMVDNTGDTVLEDANAGNDTVLSSVDFTLPANVESLALLAGAKKATGNEQVNTLTGNNTANILTGLGGNDTLNGKDGFDHLDGGDGYDRLDGGKGADILNGGNGKDKLTGGLGKDSIVLTETTAASDTVKIVTGESKVTLYDTVTGFALGNGLVTKGVDQLDLDSTAIAVNVAAADGVNSGDINSHAISNGMISFDNDDSYASALTLTADNLSDAFYYLKSNITANQTVAFNALGNTYVFQDGGITKTLVQLTGITAGNLNNTGLVADGVWLV